jgi:hypothetical protein
MAELSLIEVSTHVDEIFSFVIQLGDRIVGEGVIILRDGKERHTNWDVGQFPELANRMVHLVREKIAELEQQHAGNHD